MASGLHPDSWGHPPGHVTDTKATNGNTSSRLPIDGSPDSEASYCYYTTDPNGFSPPPKHSSCDTMDCDPEGGPVDMDWEPTPPPSLSTNPPDSPTQTLPMQQPPLPTAVLFSGAPLRQNIRKAAKSQASALAPDKSSAITKKRSPLTPAPATHAQPAGPSRRPKQLSGARHPANDLGSSRLVPQRRWRRISGTDRKSAPKLFHPLSNHQQQQQPAQEVPQGPTPQLSIATTPQALAATATATASQTSCCCLAERAPTPEAPAPADSPALPASAELQSPPQPAKTTKKEGHSEADVLSQLFASDLSFISSRIRRISTKRETPQGDGDSPPPTPRGKQPATHHLERSCQLSSLRGALFSLRDEEGVAQASGTVLPASDVGQPYHHHQPSWGGASAGGSLPARESPLSAPLTPSPLRKGDSDEEVLIIVLSPSGPLSPTYMGSDSPSNDSSAGSLDWTQQGTPHRIHEIGTTSGDRLHTNKRTRQKKEVDEEDYPLELVDQEEQHTALLVKEEDNQEDEAELETPELPEITEATTSKMANLIKLAPRKRRSTRKRSLDDPGDMPEFNRSVHRKMRSGNAADLPRVFGCS